MPVCADRWLIETGGKVCARFRPRYHVNQSSLVIPRRSCFNHLQHMACHAEVGPKLLVTAELSSSVLQRRLLHVLSGCFVHSLLVADISPVFPPFDIDVNRHLLSVVIVLSERLPKDSENTYSLLWPCLCSCEAKIAIDTVQVDLCETWHPSYRISNESDLSQYSLWVYSSGPKFPHSKTTKTWELTHNELQGEKFRGGWTNTDWWGRKSLQCHQQAETQAKGIEVVRESFEQ